MKSGAARLVLFLIVMALVIGFVSMGNEEYASAARSFLRQLFRQMF